MSDRTVERCVVVMMAGVVLASIGYLGWQMFVAVAL